MTVTETQLRERLRSVEDPSLGADIVTLGLVEDLRITDDGVAEITLAFNAPYAPDEMAMGDRVREVVSELGLETSLSVSLSWQDPDSPLPKVRNVVAIASGKGGVGKTTVATNLAVALADTGARVGLLDGDIYGPNVPQMIGVDAEPGLTDDGQLVPPEGYGVKMVSMAFLADEETDPAMLRGPMVDKLLTQLIEGVEWGTLDYLLVDLPPGTGDAQLTLMQTVPVTGSVVVTTPEDIALEDVRKGIRMFSEHGTPVLGVVENMSTFRCPNCGDDHDLYGSGGGQAVAEEYDLPLLAEIPMDPKIRARNDADGPLAVLDDSPVAKPFDGLVDAVTNRVGRRNRADVAGIDPDGGDAEDSIPSGAYLQPSNGGDDEDRANGVSTGSEATGPSVDAGEATPDQGAADTATETTDAVRDTADAEQVSDDTDTTDGVSGGLDISEN